MALDALGLALALAVAVPGGLAPLLTPDVTFRAKARAVDNWHWQAAANLDASPGTRAALLLGHDPAAATRCVRLNNYWCIKRGGWSGEIAADGEGHVAFVSAAEGATVAALLLRRYYVDYRRRSALAIVSRWAPASCGVAPPAPRRGPGSGVADGLSARGIGRTLRARWLASRGRRGFRGRASSVADRLIGATLPAPTIALGLGAAPVSLAAGLPAAAARAGAGPGAAAEPACAGDRSRIAHYAARAAAGIAPSPTEDLRLFDDAGAPTPNLARLMRNMAAVEIGPLGAGQGLVADAVAHATEVLAARRAAASAPAPAAPGAASSRRIDEGRRPRPRP